LRENKKHILKLQTKAQVGEKDKIDALSEIDSSQSKILEAEKFKNLCSVNILTMTGR